jgi:membrane carboxypeptidase/penicillin-binding protein
MSTLNIIRQRRHRRGQVHRSARQRSQRTVLGLGFILTTLLLAGVLAAAVGYTGLVRSLPSIQKIPILLNPNNGLLLQPTRLYDRTGQHLLAVLAPSDAKRTYVSYAQVPQALIQATLAVAQPDFWSSPGYELAGWQDPETHSTLAQTLVSQMLQEQQPASLVRSLHERMLAAQITTTYGREKVLEWYLNSLDYGHYAYGAAAAAQVYLGKSVSELNLGEAALLAAIGRTPSGNPIDASQVAEQNRQLVIRAMLGQGLVTPAEAAQAVRNPPSTLTSLLEGSETSGQGQLAPAFIELAIDQLDRQFGAGRVERGGLSITTSLDYELQLQAVCTTRAQLERLAVSTQEVLAADGSICAAASLLPSIQPGGSLPGVSASLVMLDPKTGQILAAVGDIHEGVQGDALASHAAGTAITPFIYLTGFSRGFNLASLGWDIPGEGTQAGRTYRGPVRLRTALANDYLPPTLHLLEQLGQDSVQAISASFGLDFPEGLRLLEEDFRVSPLALAEAYGIFADSGTLAGQASTDGIVHSNVVLGVSSLDHSGWGEWKLSQTRSLLSLPLAYLMNQVLSDETARWPSLGHPNPLEIGRPAGAKIAPALDLSGVWTVGYTPQLVTVAWLGTESGMVQEKAQEPVPGAGAGPAQAETAGPLSVYAGHSADLWHALMQFALRDQPVESWDMPPGVVSVQVCDPSGLLPTEGCPNVVNEIFLEERQPVQYDSLYQVFEINAETGLLATVFTPPEQVEKRTYMVVPSEARQWAESVGIATPPAEYDTLQRPAALPDVHITTPEMFGAGRARVEIRGSATGPDFLSYRLEYGQGLYPRTWVQIGSDVKTPVTDGLLGTWDTNGLDGLYALRLMVVRTGLRVEQALVQVTLDNTPPKVAVLYPQDGQAVSLAQEPQVVLQAQVSDPFLVKVEFYVDYVRVGEADSAPFGVVKAIKIGKHNLKVVATDRAGNTADARIDFSVVK